MKKLSASMRLANLEKVRNKMKSEGIVAYIVPSDDEHQSEYTPLAFQRRAFVSGFTGSFGLAMIGLENQNWLWTDGRYFNQASSELSSDWELMKMGEPGTPTPENFIASHFPVQSEIGIDPRVMSYSNSKLYRKAMKAKNQNLKFIETNLIDEIWSDRPGVVPERDIIVLGDETTGESISKKLEWLRGELQKNDAHLHVVSALDAIAWLYNFRGADIQCNPVSICYAIVTTDSAFLFIDPAKVSEKLSSHLKDQVTILPYDSFFEKLKSFSTGKSIWLDPDSSVAIYETATSTQNNATLISKPSPITLKKALKNATEISGMRNCGLRDAAAMIEFWSWLETTIQDSGHGLNEVTAADKLLQFRQKQQHFVTPSFDTISSVGSNAAIIHYHPQLPTAAPLDINQIYLLDSGGQYLDGTTDVTRTFHFGKPTDKERLAYTAVLKGVIALGQAIFPSHTTGLQVDILARQSLWKQGLDYRHGTGHGVGHFLNVHEGPHGISFRARSHSTALQEGMTVTNEPGYYEDGLFGIRIENQMIVKKVDTKYNFKDVGFLGFETTTYVPLDHNLINKSDLTLAEIEWINLYHQECRAKVMDLIPSNEAKEWLQRRTVPI
jgi:Xaa-Pro aminopeptidase